MNMPFTLEGNSLITLAVGIGCGICAGFFLRGRLRPRLPGAAPRIIENYETTSTAGSDGEIKLVIVVRSDLKMGKGKIAAQCSHAAVIAHKQLSKRNPELLEEWECCGQPKVVVKVDSEEALLELANHTRALQLTSSIVRDAGRTQIAPGCKTVLGVGPGPEELVNKVTGHLKLL